MSGRTEDMQYALYVVSELLQYPDSAWWARAEELRHGVDQVGLPAVRQRLADFLEQTLALEPFASEAAYVALFDFSKDKSPMLTSRGYKDEREQRQAMARYAGYYRELGYEPYHQSPDNAPALFELLSVAPAADEAPGSAISAAEIAFECLEDISLLATSLQGAGGDANAERYAGLLSVAQDLCSKLAKGAGSARRRATSKATATTGAGVPDTGMPGVPGAVGVPAGMPAGIPSGFAPDFPGFGPAAAAEWAEQDYIPGAGAVCPAVLPALAALENAAGAFDAHERVVSP